MSVKFSASDLNLIGKALISHRWCVEDQAKSSTATTDDQTLFMSEFNRCASLADKLAMTNEGAILSFIHSTNKEAAPSKDWIAHAYPLQQITVQLQGTRLSDRGEVIAQLEDVINRLKRGDMKGESHDDDFGYRFNVESTASGPSFFDKPAADN